MRAQSLTRRAVMVGTLAGAALTPFARNVAWPQAAVAGDWFSMVKQQHALIAAQLTQVLTTLPLAPGNAAAVIPQLKQLSYLLTAHGVAEENVLYPALVFHGLTVDSADLYLEQQFQKVWNAEIDTLASQNGWDGPQLQAKVQKLQTAILEHALTHEEQEYYPKLQQALSATESAALTAEYAAAYQMVKSSQTIRDARLRQAAVADFQNDSGIYLELHALGREMRVSLQVPVDAATHVLEACMLQIATAIAEVERMTRSEIPDFQWERTRVGVMSESFVMKRAFTDPDFPEKVDAVYRQITHRIKHSEIN